LSHQSTALRTFTSSNPRLLRADGIDFVLPIAMEYSHDATAAEAQADLMAEANSSKKLLEDARLRTQGELLMGCDVVCLLMFCRPHVFVCLIYIGLYTRCTYDHILVNAHLHCTLLAQAFLRTTMTRRMRRRW